MDRWSYKIELFFLTLRLSLGRVFLFKRKRNDDWELRTSTYSKKPLRQLCRPWATECICSLLYLARGKNLTSRGMPARCAAPPCSAPVPQRTGIDAALRALREGREWGRGRGDKWGWRDPIKGDKISEAVWWWISMKSWRWEWSQNPRRVD